MAIKIKLRIDPLFPLFLGKNFPKGKRITYWCLQSINIPIENNITIAMMIPITTTTSVTIASSSSGVKGSSVVDHDTSPVQHIKKNTWYNNDKCVHTNLKNNGIFRLSKVEKFFTHILAYFLSLYKFPVNDQTILQGLISCNIQLLKKHSLAYLNFTRYIQVWTYEGRAKDLIIRRDWRHPIASVLRKKLRVTSFRARTPPWSDSTGQTKQEMKGSENCLLECNHWNWRTKNVLCTYSKASLSHTRCVLVKVRCIKSWSAVLE